MPNNIDLRRQLLQRLLNQGLPLPFPGKDEGNEEISLPLEETVDLLAELGILTKAEAEKIITSPIFPFFALKVLEEIIEDKEKIKVSRGIFSLSLAEMLKQIEKKEGREIPTNQLQSIVNAILKKDKKPIENYILAKVSEEINKKIEEKKKEDENFLTDENNIRNLMNEVIDSYKKKINEESLFSKYGIQISDISYRIIPQEETRDGNRVTIYKPVLTGVELKLPNYENLVSTISSRYSLLIKNDLNKEYEISEIIPSKEKKKEKFEKVKVKYNPYKILEWMFKEEVIVNPEPEEFRKKVIKIYRKIT